MRSVRNGASLASRLAPAMHDVGVDALRHRHLGHRRTGHFAFGNYLRLELHAVSPPHHRLLACHRVHLFPSGHDRYRPTGLDQDEMAARLPLVRCRRRFECSNSLVLPSSRRLEGTPQSGIDPLVRTVSLVEVAAREAPRLRRELARRRLASQPRSTRPVSDQRVSESDQ